MVPPPPPCSGSAPAAARAQPCSLWAPRAGWGGADGEAGRWAPAGTNSRSSGSRAPRVAGGGSSSSLQTPHPRPRLPGAAALHALGLWKLRFKRTRVLAERSGDSPHGSSTPETAPRPAELQPGESGGSGGRRGTLAPGPIGFRTPRETRTVVTARRKLGAAGLCPRRVASNYSQPSLLENLGIAFVTPQELASALANLSFYFLRWHPCLQPSGNRRLQAYRIGNTLTVCSGAR
ncbi:uncharacterized protein LOC132542378 [Erinaceus europaeus]|uniref:Uncharacterized protein LOC132542378 n=1 Tax=Erinaceus europaeus TaxID=9365 RepID=A0ABM3YIN3_ERIEU|nr:uncharacterized protein LOC132542378 [Erinaceus europaeus]